MSEVVSVNVSAEKGEQKQPVPEIRVTALGIEGDAHSGTWHRQVSLLAQERIDEFGEQAGCIFVPGVFAENITTRGIALEDVRIRDYIDIGNVRLEVTQIGKACHGDGCAVFREVGRCVMPKEGIFARVLREGVIRPGDEMQHVPRPLSVKVVTLSDRASAGDYEDRSGPRIEKMVAEHFSGSHWTATLDRVVIPDDRERLQSELNQACMDGVDVLVTTGGTGVGPRDVTPDVVLPWLDRQIPGVMEYIRCKYGERIPSAQLSRSVAGQKGRMLVYVLPGSVKAVQEYMTEILTTLNHALAMVMGIDAH